MKDQVKGLSLLEWSSPLGLLDIPEELRCYLHRCGNLKSLKLLYILPHKNFVAFYVTPRKVHSLFTTARRWEIFSLH